MVLNITIEDSQPGIVTIEIIEFVDGLKKVTKKRISFDNFVNIINESTIQSEKMRIGKIPTGYYDGIIDVNGNYECLVVIPEGIKPLIYYDKTYIIPFPNLLFFFQVKNFILTSSKVFALKSQNINDNTLVYRYPFGNVSEEGSICWGLKNNQKIESKHNSMKDVEEFISMFFGSPTNDDHWMSKRVKEKYVTQRCLIESLVKESRFPSELLVNTNIKVGDLLN